MHTGAFLYIGDLQVSQFGPVLRPPGSFDTGIQAKIVRKTLIPTVL
jgi:hypothetical protein